MFSTDFFLVWEVCLDLRSFFYIYLFLNFLCMRWIFVPEDMIAFVVDLCGITMTSTIYILLLLTFLYYSFFIFLFYFYWNQQLNCCIYI